MNKGNLTRKELSEALTAQLGYSQSTCSELVDTFLDRMKDRLLNGESIKFVHFGTFNVREKTRAGDAIRVPVKPSPSNPDR